MLYSSVMIPLLVYSGLFLYSLFLCVNNVCGNPCFFWSSSFYYQGRCYKLSSESINWTEAQLMCKSEMSRGQLTEPMSDDVIAFLSFNFSLSGQDWWTGGISRSPDIGKVNIWSSTRQVINSGRTSSSGTGNCVQLTDNNGQVTTPVLENDACSEAKKYICELYVGNPCVHTLPNGHYINGYCHEIQNVSMRWTQAQERCSELKSRMAEFHTTDSYNIAKSIVERDLAREIYIAANSTVFLSDYNVLLDGLTSYTFKLSACRNASVYLWRHKSPSTIGGASGDYYEINFGLLNQQNATVTYCNKSYCQILIRSKTGANLKCTKFIESTLSWNYSTDFLKVSEPTMTVNMSASGLELFKINRMAVSTGGLSGLGIFQVSLSNIFLGSNDSLHEGVFTWMSDDQNVTMNDWYGNEPNDFYGEDNLQWRIYNRYNVKLNDINGTTSSGRPFCQRDVMTMTYLTVVPDSGSGSFESENRIMVTSGEEEVTYLRFTRRLINGTADVRADWVTSYRHAMYVIDKGLEMEASTGLYRGEVSMTSTNHVTVVVYFRSASHVASALVFPDQMLTSGYFVVSPAKPAMGNRLTIAAYDSNTDVIVRFPRNTTRNFNLKVKELVFQQIRSLKFSLKSLESVQLISDEGFSGTFIYATKPVAAYIGNGHIKDNMDSNVDMVIPVDSLSSQYITFPSLVSTTPSSQVTYRFLCLYDDTSIKINTDQIIQTIHLLKAGFFLDLNLPSNGFILLESDEQHPFYVTRLSAEGSCVTSLLPSELWRRRYDVYVQDAAQTVFIIMSSDKQTDFLQDDSLFALENCVLIKGTPLVGCSMTMSQGLHHIGFKNHSVTFAAYASQTFACDMEYCHILGLSEAFSDLKEKNSSFPALQYLALNDDEPLKVSRSTLLATTTSPSITTSTTSATSAGQASTSTLSSSGSSTLPTTTAAQTTLAPTSLPVSTPTSAAAYPLATTMAAASGNITVCFPFHLPMSNLSREAVDSLLRSIVDNLTVSTNGTLTYRMQRFSTWDSRTSSKVIGTSAVAFIVTCSVIMTLSDIVSICTYLFLLIKKIFLSPTTIAVSV